MAAATQAGKPWLVAISETNVARMFAAVPAARVSRHRTIRMGISPRQRREKNAFT
jgi:hypothetical protein